MIRKVLAILTFLAAALSAQNTTTGSPGTLTGKVIDSRGGGLGNAIVVVTGATGTAMRVVTAPDGSFTITPLNPGSYKVDIETNGVKRSGRQNVEVSAGSRSQIEITFDDSAPATPGATGIVEIEATPPTIQTDSAEVSRSYGTRIVRSLPLADRQYQDLVTLMPGVSPPTVTTDRIVDPQRTRSFNVNGQPAYANAQFQDGTYNTEAFTGRAARIQSNESMQALDIRTSNYNAEYGFAAGSWVNTVTRPGTNRVHGGLFAFNTNSFFASRNPLNPDNNPAPRSSTNQFGGNIGGPIIPDRMFFFANYEGFMQRGSELRFATVPTAAFRAGNFSQLGSSIFNPATGATTGMNVGTGRVPFPGNVIPSSAINPVSAALLAGLPLPNQQGLSNNLVGNSMLLDDTHRFDGKLDHRFSDSTTGFFRYGFTQGSIDRGSLLGVLGDAASSSLRAHNAVASVSHNFSTTLLSEFRFGYTRFRNAIGPFGDASNINSQLGGLGFSNGLPQISIGGFSPFGLPGSFPSKAINNTYNAATNWMAHTGVHKLRFGVDVHRAQASGFDSGWYGSRGAFQFGPGATSSPALIQANSPFNAQANAFAAFLVGAPSQAGVSSFLETPTYNQTRWAGYITDTINLFSKVHIELGVRYDLYSPLRTRRATGSGFFNSATNTFETGDFDRYDYNNIAPRVGIVFQPMRRVAVRAGYALHYFPTPFALAALNQAQSGAQAGLTGGFGTVPFTNVQTPAPGAATAANQPYYVTSADPRTPYLQTYSAMVQADMTHGFLVDFGYVGSGGRQLPFNRNLAAALPGTGLAGIPFAANRTAGTFERDNGINSNYNSGQVNLTKRFGAGLAIAGAYTFAKALDYGFNLANPFNLRANYGPADWDRRHILAVSHVWQLPFGAGSRYFKDGMTAKILGAWEVNGIIRWATGTPYSITADPLACACPGIASIPAFVSSPVSINGSSSFDPALFTSPQSGTFGNVSRNSVRGPDLFTYDLSLFKNFPVRENIKVELRGEAYNVTNTTNFANPVGNLNAPGFGQSLSLYNGMGGRRFQVGARLLF